MRRLRRSFFARPSTTVAPELLNKLLVAGESVGRIVEVEAYMADDPASHAFRGQTRRNATMFGKAGVLYVYFTYGMHHCANIVTGSVGDGQAVLLRAVTPVAGHRRDPGPAARSRRSVADRRSRQAVPGVRARPAPRRARPVRAPRRPCGSATTASPPPDAPRVGPRVGISVGVELPWRWRVP